MNSQIERHAPVNDQSDQQVASPRHSSRNILPVRTNVKAGGRDEIAARIQEWLQSHATEMPADEATI
ncbi:MAG TPA: hypothetical protein P5121_15625 [Caldilineaceae bacterium]|nr:hypothetical protein [Caldilineaceae bacterium]